MILFGLPAEAADDATRAAECSIALCVKTERWIGTLPPAIAARIGFKIGAHFGPIVASRLGGRSHQHITATGDTVNVSSRLMEVAARRDVRLAVSDTLRAEAERTGARLKTGSLEGPGRGADSRQVRLAHRLAVAKRRSRRSKTARIPTLRSEPARTGASYRSSGGGERSSTPPVGPCSTSSA